MRILCNVCNRHRISTEYSLPALPRSKRLGNGQLREFVWQRPESFARAKAAQRKAQAALKKCRRSMTSRSDADLQAILTDRQTPFYEHQIAA